MSTGRLAGEAAPFLRAFDDPTTSTTSTTPRRKAHGAPLEVVRARAVRNPVAPSAFGLPCAGRRCRRRSRCSRSADWRGRLPPFPGLRRSDDVDYIDYPSPQGAWDPWKSCARGRSGIRSHPSPSAFRARLSTGGRFFFEISIDSWIFATHSLCAAPIRTPTKTTHKTHTKHKTTTKHAGWSPVVTRQPTARRAAARCIRTSPACASQNKET